METVPTVAVVIPTRNRAPMAQRAIQSAMRQTVSDLELIVVDDGSVDSTPELLRTFNDPRFVAIRDQTPRGANAAPNQGVRVARGAFVAFLDDDNSWLPHKLERQLAAIGDAEAIVCGAVSSGGRRFPLHHSAVVTPEDLRRGCRLWGGMSADSSSPSKRRAIAIGRGASLWPRLGSSHTISCAPEHTIPSRLARRVQ